MNGQKLLIGKSDNKYILFLQKKINNFHFSLHILYSKCVIKIPITERKARGWGGRVEDISRCIITQIKN